MDQPIYIYIYISDRFLVHIKRIFSAYTLLVVLLLLTSLRVFTSTLVDGFSMKFEWQQVSSSLQDSS